MVNLDFIKGTNAGLANQRSITAVFTGGTSGIGEYTIRALVKHYSHSEHALRIFIVGRNASAADRIILECKAICPNVEMQFITAADLSLLRNVDECCKKLSRAVDAASKVEAAGDGGSEQKTKEAVAPIDLLFMSHCDTIHFGARRETPEGLDKTTSLLYYSRLRILTNLLPHLLAGARPAHIISVYAGGLEKGLPSFHPDDLSLRDPKKYGLIAYRTHVTVMKTLLFEKLAKEHEGKLSLVHVFPGLVITPAFDSRELPFWFRILWTLMSPLLKYFVAIGPEETGERMLYLSTDRFPARSKEDIEGEGEGVEAAVSTDNIKGGGAYSVNQKSETNDLKGVYESLRKQGWEEKVWKHTMDAFATIEAGRKFEG